MICSLLDAGCSLQELGELDLVRTRLLYNHPRDESGRLRVGLPDAASDGQAFRLSFFARCKAEGKTDAQAEAEWLAFILGLVGRESPRGAV